MASPIVSKLPEEARVFVVQSLACFDSPGVVSRAVKQEFGIQITPQACESYDPTKRAGHHLRPKWKTMFEETRKAFLSDASAIGISHKTVRLRALQRMAAKAEDQGNLRLAADLHKQAAEEMGGAYTNERRLGGPNGEALPANAALVTFTLPDNGRRARADDQG